MHLTQCVCVKCIKVEQHAALGLCITPQSHEVFKLYLLSAYERFAIERLSLILSRVSTELPTSHLSSMHQSSPFKAMLPECKVVDVGDPPQCVQKQAERN